MIRVGHGKTKKTLLILTYDSGEREYNANDRRIRNWVFGYLKNQSAASNWEYEISFAIFTSTWNTLQDASSW
jgi:hypothetical protein